MGAPPPGVLVAPSPSVSSSVVRTRLGRRLGTLVLAVAVPLLVSAGPALAGVKPDDGEVSGPPLGIGDTILIFVVIPIGAFLIISGLSVLPSALRRPRYRPGKGWEHDAIWIGGPQPTAEPPADAGTPTARGGASAEW